MSTDGLHLKTVAMLQGSSHLRVQSSAEFKFAAGSIPIWGYETCTGKTGSISNRGVTVFISTADAQLTIGRPVQGYWKKIVFQAKKATSCIQKVLPTSKGIKLGVGSTNTGIFCSSFANKHMEGAYIELLGHSTYQWLILGKSSTNVVSLTLTSATG